MQDKTTEELLAELEGQELEQRQDPVSEIERFVIDLDITLDPNSRVEGKYIYFAYLQWFEEKEQRSKRYHKPLTRLMFFRQFSRFFPKLERAQSKYYTIKKDGFELDEQGWWRMQNQIRDEREKARKKAESRRKQKENKKKSSEVPRAGEALELED